MNTPEHLEQAKACFFEGNTLFEAGRLEEAADRYQSALALVPGRPSILANLGVTQCRLGRWPEAVATLQQATQAEGERQRRRARHDVVGRAPGCEHAVPGLAHEAGVGVGDGRDVLEGLDPCGAGDAQRAHLRPPQPAG